MKSLESRKYLKYATIIVLLLLIGGFIYVKEARVYYLYFPETIIFASLAGIVLSYSWWYYWYKNEDHSLLRAVLLVLFSIIGGIASVIFLIFSFFFVVFASPTHIADIVVEIIGILVGANILPILIFGIFYSLLYLFSILKEKIKSPLLFVILAFVIGVSIFSLPLLCILYAHGLI